MNYFLTGAHIGLFSAALITWVSCVLSVVFEHKNVLAFLILIFTGAPVMVGWSCYLSHSV